MTPPPKPDGDAILPRDTRSSLPMALLRAREAVMARFRPLLAEAGINEQQWRVIRVLAEAGPLDATEVAARANILAPSLTRMIRAMTERGLIHQMRDERDRRRIVLSISDTGEALIGQVSPHSLRVYRDLEQEFGAERIAQLLQLLHALAALDNPSD
ncbi:homoprotocatechuate degradation operon regulator HpaR [Aliigemmobacter aestuarii]|uniref:Homoprotocatechuate degradation operon regulator HpaR n=1 Tax=Aliigemmobacter aestuarii TaxID=1445661 RepID=A0A4S3MMV0_9RHOB|nr:homoprotocatechuate degradation operon regulator HpaR [Gemmobacter aestuarii]THD83728.1 homoprotocatechuate degradation operon regulator HpaR [Gemmobacter aestuarii]